MPAVDRRLVRCRLGDSLAGSPLQRVIAALLLVVAVVLLFGHESDAKQPALEGAWLIAAGVAAGLLIDAVASLLGVAGGELLIPTLVLLYGLDIKLAGSLSLAVGLPTHSGELCALQPGL